MFKREGVLYRQVNEAYRDDYSLLTGSGLYAELSGNGLMVSHEETEIMTPRREKAYKIIRPERIPFISYPYEWCFSALKDAALLTLDIQLKALAYGMTLKDASAFNVLFLKGRPIFIDTLSFEKYEEGKPWAAYGQFCRHFLAPLALMSTVDARFGRLLGQYLDGIPLDLASPLLPGRTRFNAGLLTHLHLHARSQQHFKDKEVDLKGAHVSKYAVAALAESLKSTISRLGYEPEDTDWKDYYSQTNYTDESFLAKKELVKNFIGRAAPDMVWDFGSNTALYSRLASGRGALTVALESNHDAVEVSYRELKSEGNRDVLPLVMDLFNPSPGSGWANRERESLSERGPCDLGLALALLHHLAFGNNLPFEEIAAFFASTCRRLIIEFVPKDDSFAGRLLRNRKDIFTDYTPENFETAFSIYFAITEKAALPDSGRILYFLKRND